MEVENGAECRAFRRFRRGHVPKRPTDSVFGRASRNSSISNARKIIAQIERGAVIAGKQPDYAA